MTAADYKKLVDAMKASSLEKLLDTHDFSFGLLLRLMLEQSGVRARTVCDKLAITKTYFYDVLKGSSKPPPAEKQFELVKLLHPSKRVRAAFFDLAAKERGEFPVDLARYFRENELYGALREKYKL